MKTTSTLFPVGLLALSMHLPLAIAIPPRDKIGTCPSDLVYHCLVPGHNYCNIDYDCPGIQKCCAYKCDKMCRYPADKPGNCPSFPFKCSGLAYDECQHDNDCPKTQKCCYINCGKNCINP